MDDQLLTHLSDILGEKMLRYQRISGGDISDSFLIVSPHRRLFLKLHEGPHALDLFEAERSGLESIAVTRAIRTPHVVHCGKYDVYALLLMEYIETKEPEVRDYENLGHQLAKLHEVTTENFGWTSDNFIGNLPQHNDWLDNWKRFYLEKRLLPQIAMARDSGKLAADEIPGELVLSSQLDTFIPDIRPSFLHGDLWNGNFLISAEGEPVLIDPSVYYGHHEVDLAMSRLFGGFAKRFYDAYTEIIAVKPGAKERNDIYQLYYLLVHLNLFGNTYKPAVIRIVRRYFG